MYKNLEAEMTRHNISKKCIAEFLNIRYATVIDKLNGKYDFKLNEAFAIRKKFFQNLSLEYLFQKEEEIKTKEVS